MKQKTPMKLFNQPLLEGPEFSEDALNWIAENNLWNLWVPKAYNGLELGLSEGLQKLQELAKINGSLGWTVTLCSGANYFIGNLNPEARSEIFLSPKKNICFGGSGGVLGTAEQQGNNYIISGEWHYATGAPYLTHFTLNAKITKKGVPILNEDGAPLVYSFVIPKEAVTIIKNWNTMGLKTTATHSFKVNAFVVSFKYAFVYNTYYLPQPIFKIPFAVFADLTLWVNYVGMAAHFFNEATSILEQKTLEPYNLLLLKTNQQLYKFAEHIELLTSNNTVIPQNYIENIHTTASTSVKQISNAILNSYPLLGIKACSEQHILNLIFKDYFTATQHPIFSK